MIPQIERYRAVSLKQNGGRVRSRWSSAEEESAIQILWMLSVPPGFQEKDETAHEGHDAHRNSCHNDGGDDTQ